MTSSTKLAEIQITIRELNSRKTKRKSIKHVQTPAHFPSPFRFVLFSGFWRTAFPSSLFYKKSSKCRKSFYLSFTTRFAEESSTRQSISISYSLTPCSDQRKHKSKLSVLLMCPRSIPRHQNFPWKWTARAFLSSNSSWNLAVSPSFQIRKRLSSENLNRTPFCKRRKSFTRPSIRPQAKELQALPHESRLSWKLFVFGSQQMSSHVFRIKNGF